MTTSEHETVGSEHEGEERFLQQGQLDPRDEETASASEEQGSFAELGLAPEILVALQEMGYAHPTEVQIKTIPLALEGRDLLVQSRTGTGKTAAFGIVLVQRQIGVPATSPRALVLTPTRELAIQVARECSCIAAKSAVKVTAIYGGAAMGPQADALRSGTQVVVGTPGRLLDHIRRGNLDTSAIQTLVLDEGDEMLSMGFLEEISAIIEQLPDSRHTMLFSATMPEAIQRLVDRYTRDAVRVCLSQDFVGAREITHVYYLISGADRQGDLLRILAYEKPETAIIFCNTREETSLVAEFLQGQGFTAEGISSDLTQRDRERVMQKMRGGNVRFLVATDIAARGIDLSDLSHVINYTFPESADVYVHRTGRTGRAGKTGTAVSLVSPREIGSFYYLKLIHKIYPEERHLPSPEEVAARREGERFERLLQRYQGVEPSAEMRSLARRIWSTVDGERIIAILAASALEEPDEVFRVRAAAAAPPREERKERAEREERAERGEREERRPPRAPRQRFEEREAGGQSRRRERRRERGDGREQRDTRGREHPKAVGGPPTGQDRKTKRTRRRSGSPEEQGSFTTSDGDIEYWEVVEGPAEPSEPTEPSGAAEPSGAGEARLFINVGRYQGARPAELIQFIQAETGLTHEQLGKLQIRNSYSFVNVPEEHADRVIEQLKDKAFGERQLRVERAKK